MKTNAEKIKAILASGSYAASKFKDGEYKVFMYIDINGCFQGTQLENTIEECLHEGLSPFKYSEKDVNEEFSNIQVLPRKITYFKPGDKVRVLETARDLPDFDCWRDKYKEMVGGVCEIKSIDGSVYDIWNTDKSDWYYFPLHIIAPAFEDEPQLEQTTDELIAELERRGVVQDSKIIIN